MNQITYLKQSLFDAPKGSIIIHAVNTQGVWGAGIAADFARRYPKSYSFYQDMCMITQDERRVLVGTAKMGMHPTDESHWIGWIYTSEHYGSNKDSRETIKAQTAIAIYDLCSNVYSRHNRGEEIAIYSNKFNSGLFGVPWHETEEILKAVLKHYKRVKWYVCDPKMKEVNYVG